MLDEDEFLSPYGLRTLSAAPPGQAVHGRRWAAQTSRVGYEPAESTSGLFGGNSNWRGPVWFPVNYLLIEALRRVRRVLRRRPAGRVPDRLGHASCTLDAGRRRPVRAGWSACSCDDATAAGRSTATYELFQTDPDWHDLMPFPEYFHGDTGAGLGASHQTGWTGLVADLLLHRG